jgi:hypothetical protein
MIVSLDVQRRNAVTAAARPYNTHIAGVVSAQPGVILGQGGAGKVMATTTGRVKVKVEAGRRGIRIGDLLVASGRPGVAMRSQPVRVRGTLMHRPGRLSARRWSRWRAAKVRFWCC